jgi:tRNA-Thr(GGU) m(6)t(6)A37 methyltransferase TsaA
MNRKFILIFVAYWLIIPCMNSQNIEKKIEYKPIGVFHSPLSPGTGAPRQGVLKPDIKGSIEVFPDYQKALEGIDLFDYIIVIYHFDRVTGWKDIVIPPGSNHNYSFGTFATRTPRRPNPIGFAVIKLDRVENGILYVSGIDAFDGTPVLDIKPYLPSIDCVDSKKNKSVEQDLGLEFTED